MADLSQIRVSGTLYDIKDATARMAIGSPAVAATASAMTDQSRVYVYTGSESGYTNGNWYYYNGSSWVSGGVYNSATVETDTSLSVSGAPADAKVTGDSIKYIVSVGDTAPSDHTQILVANTTSTVDVVTTEEFDAEISDLKSAIAQGGSFNAEVKQALMQCINYVAWKDNDPNASQYISALQNALYPPVNLVSISAVYTQSGTVYNTDSLDSLKSDLVVTAHYSDATTAEVSNYVLSGSLIVGTSTITVTYGGKTTTFTVEVTNDLYLYELSAPVTMTGTQAVDTGVEFEADQIMTILADFTPTTLDTTVRFVYSNQISTENTYLGLQLKQAYMWGMGRGYNAGNNLAVINKRYRVAVVVSTTASACNCTQYVRKVTDASTLSSVSTQYTAMEGVLNDNTIKIGDATTGFIGTIHDFKIYNGEMASADITSWLENGA